MKSKITNNYVRLHIEMQRLLNIPDITSDEVVIAKYMEIPWFPGGQFSIYLVKNNQNAYKLIKKVWIMDKTISENVTGIYNPNHLTILKNIYPLSFLKIKEFEILCNEIVDFPISLDDENAIVLDGVEYTLEMDIKNNYRQYYWKYPTEDIKIFKKIILFLKQNSKE